MQGLLLDDPVKDARLRLSMAINERPYLGRWFRDEVKLKKAKVLNKAEQDHCRAILFKASKGGTIWYYRNPPTAGNRFRIPRPKKQQREE